MTSIETSQNNNEEIIIINEKDKDIDTDNKYETTIKEVFFENLYIKYFDDIDDKILNSNNKFCPNEEEKILSKKVKRENTNNDTKLPNFSKESKMLKDLNKELYLKREKKVLNGKNISWKMEVKSITGWCCFGITQRKKSLNKISLNYFEKHKININHFSNSVNYLYSNDFNIISSNKEKKITSNKEDIIKISNGDVVNFTYIDEENILIIENNEHKINLDILESNKKLLLVPCFICDNPNDFVIFKDYIIKQN